MRRIWLVLGAAVALIAVGGYWFAPWKLVTNHQVDESLPAVSGPLVAATASSRPAPGPTVADVDGSPSSTPAVTPPASTAPTPAPAQRRVEVAAGRFISHEHTTTGRVRVVRESDGSELLAIEGLDTSDGPDLHVWLTDAPVIDGQDGWRVFDDGAYVDLGRLRGNRGNLVYELPADLDLSRYRSVSIWCSRFSVSFGAAALTAA